MDDPLADDLLLGAGPIAKFLFKEQTTKKKRKVYHLHERGLLPTFHLGAQLAARKSTLRAHIENIERRSIAESAAER
jgi:hypothetical protein